MIDEQIAERGPDSFHPTSDDVSMLSIILPRLFTLHPELQVRWLLTLREQERDMLSSQGDGLPL